MKQGCNYQFRNHKDIFFNSAILDGHISTYFNKDTCDLFMLCIVFMCQLYCVVFYYCRSIILLLFDLYLILLDFCFHSILLLFIVHCAWENFQFWSWIVFQIFWSRSTRCKSEVPVTSSMQVNNHQTSDCIIFVLVSEWVAYYNHRNNGIYRTNILQAD